MKWITRERPKIDRIACPWLIKRFVDKDAVCSVLYRYSFSNFFRLHLNLNFYRSDSAITKEFKNGLLEDGFDIGSLAPVPLTTKDVNPNTLLISLDCTIPTSYTTYRIWTGISAIRTDYQAARNEIVKQLNQLILELKKREALK